MWILSKSSVVIWEIIGIMFLFVSVLIFVTDPLDAILDNQLRFSQGSYVYNLWEEPPVSVYIRVYVFNVTNPIEFLKGKEKMKLQEIGPYVYTESVKHVNVSFNDNDTVTYHPTRNVTLRLDLSIGDPRDLDIIVPNVAMLGISSMLANSSMISNLGLLALLRVVGSQPFLNMSAHDYLWGYDDPLIKVANTVVSSWIPFARLGVLDRLYDDGDNSVTMRLSDNGLSVDDPGYLAQYSLDMWNGSPGLNQWGYKPQTFQNRSIPLRPEPEERCQLIAGATEGVIFPRNIPQNMTIWAYRKAFCRVLPIVFDREGFTESGLRGFWFKINEDVFETPANNREQKCYCDPAVKKCLPKGLSDLTPCYYNIPTAVSFPHFYQGDPKLITDVEGLSPDREKHSTTVILQPDLGAAMRVRIRIQTNLVVHKLKYNAKLRPFNDLVLPLFWAEMSLDELPHNLVILLTFVTFVLPVCQTVLYITLFLGGWGIIIYQSIRYWLFCHNSANKYSAVRLTPLTKTGQIVSEISRRSSMVLASRKNSLASIRRNSTMLPL